MRIIGAVDVKQSKDTYVDCGIWQIDEKRLERYKL